MAKKEDNTELNRLSESVSGDRESDAAGKSLSEALEVSFTILKVIIIILIVGFLVSGFKTVGSGEEALVLRFGKIRGTGEKRVLTSGAHWILPYPIDKIVKIPVAQKKLNINTFWYYLTEQEQLAGRPNEIDPNKALDPLRDGYCLTRSKASQGNAGTGEEGNDYNIVHTQWSLIYHISNPELFFTNVQTPDAKPGDIYDDVINEGVEPFLQSMFEDIVVTKMVGYTIDEAITSKDRIPNEIKEALKTKLESINSGIEVISVQLTESDVPRQVKRAFDATTKASQAVSTAITDAENNKTKLLNETAGPVAIDLYKALHNDSISKEKLEDLWSQLSGNNKQALADAQIYAANVVNNAQSSAEYLRSLLPEYRKRPDIVINRLYYNAMEKILSNAEEKFIVQNSKDAKGSELWVYLNKFSSLKSKDEEGQTQSSNNK